MVTVGHDGSGFRPDWYLEFASIYVESMREYYVFRKNDPVWIKKDRDILLPLKGWWTYRLRLTVLCSL